MALDELETVLNREYDVDICHGLYFADPYDLEGLYISMIPLVKIVISKEVFWPTPDLIDEVQQAGMVGLYEALKYRKYMSRQEKGADHFGVFFYTTVKRAVYDILCHLKMTPDDGSEFLPEVSRMIHPNDVLNHLYLEQLPRLIRIMVKSRIRFQGNEGIACKYILDRVLKGADIALGFLKRDLKIKNPQFFIDYILVLVRWSLYRLKSKSRSNQYFTSMFDYSYDYGVIE